MGIDGAKETDGSGLERERERERESQGKIPCHITQKDQKKERDVVFR